MGKRQKKRRNNLISNQNAGHFPKENREYKDCLTRHSSEKQGGGYQHGIDEF